MKRNKLMNYCLALLLFVGSIDVSMPESGLNDSENLIRTGINGKQVQQGVKAVKKGWTFLRSCARHEKEAEKIIRNPKIEGTTGKIIWPNRLLVTTEILGKSIGEAKTADEILPKIGEYLSQINKPNEGEWKVITCFRNEANKVRMCLYEYGNNTPKISKLISGAKEAINLAEYDIHAMQENFYRGTDGIEYVNFVIPRKTQYILDGKYDDRIYECMVFNIPKDIEGGWKRFKEYLIAFINDIIIRPVQLWDEYMFRRGLTELNINSRDVNEIEQYMFAHINENKRYEFIKHIQKQVA